MNVLFDNGARLAYSPRDNVDIVVDRIPDHSELPWGSQILVNRPRSRAFEIGYIRDIKNGRFVILYENGEEIMHTLDQLRVFNKSRICGKCIKESTVSIHLIPKWRPINYSFVSMFISPLCLIFTSKFFCVFYMLTRHQGLINMQTKE